MRPTPAAVATPSTSAASSATFVPLAASRCARPLARKSSRTSSASASSCPSTIPRPSAAALGDRAPDSACSARRRTPSSAPATPPRRRPVGSSRSTEICAWAPRRRSYSSAGPSASIRPRTLTSAPVGDRGHRARTPPCDARRSTTRSPLASSAGASTVPHAVRSGGSRTVAVMCTWRPMSGVSVVASIASVRACATSAPTAIATTIAGTEHRGGRRTTAHPEREPRARTGHGERGRDRGHRPPARRRRPERPAPRRVPRAGDAADGATRRRPTPSHRHQVAQRLEAHLADPGHVAELLDGAEPAVLLAERQDLRRRRRADARERVELLGRRGVEVDLRRASPPATSSRARSLPAARVGTSTCLPSSTTAARFTAERSARRAGPPARRTASSTRSPRRSR